MKGHKKHDMQGRGKMHMGTHGSKDTGAHHTHHTMNKAHGTPNGFGAPHEYDGGCEHVPDDDADCHSGSMTDSY